MHRHILFLLLLPLALAARDDVDHCIAFDWTSGGSLDLNPLIAPDPGLPPVIPVDTWRNLNRQCLRQGEHTDAYIARRPILPSGTQPLVP